MILLSKLHGLFNFDAIPASNCIIHVLAIHFLVSNRTYRLIGKNIANKVSVIHKADKCNFFSTSNAL